MGDDQRDQTCGICCCHRDDLRILPCWHIACMTCILGMAQTGKGRAVSCHACRQTCLFENIRSLPIPVRCHMCKNFVKTPKKFPCCSKLYCTDCITNIVPTFGTVLCPNNCSLKPYSAGDVQYARICCVCFCLHTEKHEKCGHSICTKCYLEQIMQKKECALCVAARDPLPVPIDLIQQPPGQLPTWQQFGTLLTSAVQTSRALVRRIHALQVVQPQQLRRNTVPNVTKPLVYGLLVVIVGYVFGLRWWLWVFACVTSVLFHPTRNEEVFTSFMSVVVMSAIGLYYHFWEAVVLISFDLVGYKLFEYVLHKTLDDGRWKIRAMWLFGNVHFAITATFCSPIFLHRHFCLALFNAYNTLYKNNQ